jgi:hypothetical protein
LSIQDPVIPGSAFINNTSYSGCDIKVVLHMYDIVQANSELLKEARQNLADIQDRLTKVESALGAAMRAGLAELPSTPGKFVANAKHVSLAGEKQALLASKMAAEEIIKRLNKQTPKISTKVLAEAQTISLSVFRDKQAVRSLGSVYPKGFVRGAREIAGSMIFTVFNESVLYEFLNPSPSDFDGVNYTSGILDQIPPVDVTISFANEYGQLSRMTIYGVEFLAEGLTMSVEDLLTESTVNFVARDYDPMRAVGQRKIDAVSNRLQQDLALKGSSLLLENDYKKYKDQVSPFARFSRRRNPFL